MTDNPQLERPARGQVWHGSDGQRWTIAEVWDDGYISVVPTKVYDEIPPDRWRDDEIVLLRMDAIEPDAISGSLATPEKTLPPQMAGEFCPTCGSPNMVRTGACMTCQDCGWNGGCG